MKQYTSKEIEQLFIKKEYEVKMNTFSKSSMTSKGYDWEKYRKAQQDNSFMVISTLFDTLIEKLERIPSQKEYIKEGLNLVRKNWNKRNRDKFSKEHELAFRFRIGATYISKVIELHAEVRLKELYPNANIFSHILVDCTVAADIIFDDNETGKRYYIHVLKDSMESRNFLIQKESRGKFKYENKWFQFKRDFSTHSHLYYNFKDKKINGQPFISDAQLIRVIAKAKMDNEGEKINGNTQLDKLKEWLKENNISWKKLIYN